MALRSGRCCSRTCLAGTHARTHARTDTQTHTHTHAHTHTHTHTHIIKCERYSSETFHIDTACVLWQLATPYNVAHSHTSTIS